ncbi:MAG: aminotransferase class V-fold PLP-dependent enzyme [Proteobacteria bacterium]|nr:aminotransferase class V-fold PLP-dependent enzyme [Pseudomonadota bacterium]
MIDNQRGLFDIPEGVAFLNCASRSPLLRASSAAGEAGVRRKVYPWDYDTMIAPREAEELRALFAGLIGAEPGDVAIVPAASYGIGTAAINLPVGPGQSILMPQEPFPSHFYAWRERARDTGARIETVPEPADGDWTAAVLECIRPETAVAALPTCRWTDGAALDAEAIGARCRETGTALVLDATQTAGAMPLDVGRIRPDFLIAAAYKWLLCPYTLAFLYAAPERQDGRSLEGHMYNHLNAAAVEGPVVYPEARTPGARRYDMGEVFNPIHLPMAVAALGQLAAWTPAAIAETLRPLIERIAEAAAERGLTVPPAGHRVGHFIGLRAGAGWPEGLVQALAAERVYVSLRAGTLRISPHLFNTADDVDRLFRVLDRLR